MLHFYFSLIFLNETYFKYALKLIIDFTRSYNIFSYISFDVDKYTISIKNNFSYAYSVNFVLVICTK